MRTIKWLITISVIVLMPPFFLYWMNFGSSSFSKHFRDWIDFSQYYGVFIALFNGIILVWLTLRIHKENTAFNKPILIFTINDDQHYPHKIKNIGNGAAINIE